VRLTSSTGQSGLGEASPLPGYSPDTLDDVARALEQIAPAALADALDRTPARAALRAIAALAGPALPSARMALETAALDLLGRAQGLAAPLLLGSLPGAERPLAQLLGPASDPELDERASVAVAAGFRHLKLKLGGEGALAREISGVLRLRKRFGSGVALRLDANRALAAGDVRQAWDALEHAGIELFEEPGQIPESLEGRLPLGLDESLQGLSEDEVAGVLRRLHPRCLVLKPMALGGLDHCWRLAERARDHGVDVLISHCFDGPLALRAASALALALPRGPAHGLAAHPALEALGAASGALRGATLQAWREPGLGDLGNVW
jgi:L-alanine-DL-glutamate epimerase-like enolase superfamily enzyme